jgi:hypothetical protein
MAKIETKACLSVRKVGIPLALEAIEYEMKNI